MNPEKLQSLVTELFEEVRTWREHMHRNPEPSFQEKNTMLFVSEILSSYGIEHETNVAETGVVAWIGADHHTKNDVCIGLRSDLDALPIQEENDVPYKSEIDFNNFSLKELNKLPIVEKQDIQNDINRFLREDVNPSKLRWKATSGSSGKPFQVPKSYFSDAIEVLLGYRAWSMGRFLYKLREPAIVLRSFSPKENEPIYRRDRVRNFWYISPYHINENYLEEFLNIFKKSKAKILKGYPSSIYILTLLH